MYKRIQLSDEESKKIFDEVTNGNEQNIEKLISANIGLVYRVINDVVKKKDSLISEDDLVQEGVIGLIGAIKNFDPSISSFGTYAYWKIYGAIMRYYSSNASLIRVPSFIIFDYYKTAGMNSSQKDQFLAENNISKKTFGAAENAMNTLFFDDVSVAFDGENSNIIEVLIPNDDLMEDSVIRGFTRDDISEIIEDGNSKIDSARDDIIISAQIRINQFEQKIRRKKNYSFENSYYTKQLKEYIKQNKNKLKQNPKNLYKQIKSITEEIKNFVEK